MSFRAPVQIGLERHDHERVAIVDHLGPAVDGPQLTGQRPTTDRGGRASSAWIAQPDAVALATVDAGRVAGYGVVRRCKAGCKIGPLFANDAGVATGLFRALAASMPGEVIVLDVPETNPAAVALAERHGMTSVFETARMYTKDAPAIAIDRVFGVTSFELG